MNAFIIDTNIIFSALLRDSPVRKIILSDIFELFTPEFLFTEIRKYETFILKKSGLNKHNFDLLLLLLQSHLAVVPFSNFSSFLNKAEAVMSRIDLKDAPFLALAMKLNIPIWSNDLHLKKQESVSCYTTEEIFHHFISAD